jgi:hypothetical protein
LNVGIQLNPKHQPTHLRNTHRAFCDRTTLHESTTSSTRPLLETENSPFAKLPRELRDKIWEESFHFKGGIGITFYEKDVIESSTRQFVIYLLNPELCATTSDNIVLGVTKSCKQIRTECLERLKMGVFFSQNAFNIDLAACFTEPHKGYHNPEGHACAFIAFLGDAVVSRIRHINLRLGTHLLLPYMASGDWAANRLKSPSYWQDTLAHSASSICSTFELLLSGFPAKLTVSFGVQYDDSQHQGSQEQRVLRFELPFHQIRQQTVEALVMDRFRTENQLLRKAFNEGTYSKEEYSTFIQSLQLCRVPLSLFIGTVKGRL